MQSDGSVNDLPATLASLSNASHYQHINLVSDQPVTQQYFAQPGAWQMSKARLSLDYRLDKPSYFSKVSNK